MRLFLAMFYIFVNFFPQCWTDLLASDQKESQGSCL